MVRTITIGTILHFAAATKETTPGALSSAPVGMRLVRRMIDSNHATVPIRVNHTAVPLYEVADCVALLAGATPDYYRSLVRAVAGMSCTPGEAAGSACRVYCANFHSRRVLRPSPGDSCPCGEKDGRRACGGGQVTEV